MSPWQILKHVIRSVQEIGVKQSDPTQATKIRFLNSASLIAMITLCINFTMDFLSHRAYYPVWLLALTFPVVVFFVFIANRFWSFHIAKFLFLVVFTTLFLSGNLINSFIGTENFLFVTLLMGFNVLDRKISFILLTLYYAFLYSLIVWGMDVGYLKQGDLPRHYYYVNASLAIIIVGILTYRYSSLVASQVATMHTLNNDLRKKNALASNLLKELNHRVKNNLQIISSLFNLQGNSSENPETKQALSEARSRINAIAILHQKLYQEDLVFEVDAKEYLQSLCDYLHHSDSSSQDLLIDLFTPSITLQIKETIYLGLMVNELITNAQKYARKPSQILKILVQVSQPEPKHLTLHVQDNGPGFSTQFPDISEESFGLGLVRTIAEQYDGRIRMGNTDSGGAFVVVGMILP